MIKDIRPALRAFLLGAPAISTAVGGNRVFPVQVPQGVRGTAIVYQRITSVADHHMQGASGLMTARMQITCWAATIDAADTLADLVQLRLDGYRGPMQASPAPAIHVGGVFLDSDNPPLFDQSLAMHGIGRDYFLHYQQRA